MLLTSSMTEFDRAVQIITRLRSNHTSFRGLKYRSMVCAIVRNDPHILEFILRNLISGFSHFVIYDNNRIGAGYDMDIKALLAPFIAAGVVTHVPWNQDTSNLLDDGSKNGNSAECLAKYGKDADWITILDTDEYFYYEKNNTSVHTLNDLLLELEQNNVCGITVKWSMMYGEAKVLKQNKTLFEAYPRICGTHVSGKVIARPELVNLNIPHGVACKSPNQTTAVLASNKNYSIFLIHYYSKSIEEFLVKSDQSVPPFIREMIRSYDLGATCQLVPVNYSSDYLRLFLNTHQRMESMDSLKIKTLQRLPILNYKHMADYTLYMFMKYRCAKRHEFDNEKYLSINSEAKTRVEKGTVVDGLYHFMENYKTGIKSCWKFSNTSFCE